MLDNNVNILYIIYESPENPETKANRTDPTMKKNTNTVNAPRAQFVPTSSYRRPDKAPVVDRVEDDDNEEVMEFSIATIWENPNRFPSRIPAHAW